MQATLVLPQIETAIEITGPLSPEAAEILTPEALRFLAMLARRFEGRRQALLQRRQERQVELDAGQRPDFLPETREIRESEWTIAPLPAELQRRRVEITGPVDRKMVINALNSGADVFMADFEDATAPTWDNCIEGQRTLRDAVLGTLSYRSPEGKQYSLNRERALLMVRPRGWHLDEKHLRIDGLPIAGAIFDCGLFLFHNAHQLRMQGSAPYLYLPKLESHLEARLWNEIFLAAQEALGLPRGTIKATVLIETILAAFEMDEILYELREHAAGLNCGRWDYIFSFIKKFRQHPDALLPDRALVGMTTPCMRAYSRLVIQSCHRRGAHAIGGMAAQIPIKHDPEANALAMARVRADKEREVEDGHDGTWVAHPGLVPLAMEVFQRMGGPNQIGTARPTLTITADELLAVPIGPITEAGVRTNIRVGIQYLAAWLRGQGCVPLYNLMEDAATAEISRAQLWQWRRHRARLDDGRLFTPTLCEAMLGQEAAALQAAHPEQVASLAQATGLFASLVTADEFTDFLTLPAYALLP